MSENYDHYITRNIKSVYKRKLIAPIIYLVLLAVLWLIFPIFDIMFPHRTESYDQLKSYYEDGNTYVETQLKDLYFTGYTNTRWGQTDGYYYYTMMGSQCMFVLLSPFTSEEGLPHIKELTIRARVLRPNKSYQQLTSAMAEDLGWTEDGLKSKVSSFLLSEPAYHSILSFLVLLLYFATGLYALAAIIVYILYIIFPVLSPPCWQLGRFGKTSQLLVQAEDELATLPQLATEDMFITEHFFIEIADSGIAIVPIQEMLWIYKYSTLHKFFWYHFNISYTLHITANKHLYIQCPKNMKSDIDGIIDYLAEANHDVLVGFSEENRLKVQELQDPTAKFEKLISFLKRRF